MSPAGARLGLEGKHASNTLQRLREIDDLCLKNAESLLSIGGAVRPTAFPVELSAGSVSFGEFSSLPTLEEPFPAHASGCRLGPVVACALASVRFREAPSVGS